MTRIIADISVSPTVALGIESFGGDDAPLVLLAGGTTMLSWPDALCAFSALTLVGTRAVAPGPREIPGARLLVLKEAATAIPDAAVGEVTEAMLTLG